MAEMNTPSPPPVPSASSIVQASQQANNINQVSPWGSLTYNQSPGGQWTATQTVDPNVQAAVNSGIANSTAAMNNIQPFVNNAQSYMSNIQPAINNIQPAASGAINSLNQFNAQSGPVDPSGAINKAISMENQYMQPWFNQQQSNLNSQLQNEGFSVGSQAYQNAQRDLQNNQTNWVGGNVAQFEPLAYNQSQTSYFDPLQAATGQAGIANTMANNAGTLAGIAGTAANSAGTMAGIPGQLAGAAGGLRTAGAPGYVTTPQADVTGAYNTQVQGNEYNYGQQMANNNAMLGGLFSIPAAAAGGWAKAGFPGIGSLAAV